MSRTNSLYVLDAEGKATLASADEVIAAAREHLSRRLRRGNMRTSPKATRDFLAVRVGKPGIRDVLLPFLDAHHRLIEFAELFRGTLDGASVHPREVAREALRRNCAAVIFCHPHPAG